MNIWQLCFSSTIKSVQVSMILLPFVLIVTKGLPQAIITPTSKLSVSFMRKTRTFPSAGLTHFCLHLIARKIWNGHSWWQGRWAKEVMNSIKWARGWNFYWVSQIMVFFHELFSFFHTFPQWISCVLMWK